MQTLEDDLRNGGYSGKMYVKSHLEISCMELGNEGPFYYEIQNIVPNGDRGTVVETKVYSNSGSKFLKKSWGLDNLLHDERLSADIRATIVMMNPEEVRLVGYDDLSKGF